MTKEELIAKVTKLAGEAYYGWVIRDGWAGHEQIKAEQKRIMQDRDAIIEYIKNNC